MGLSTVQSKENMVRMKVMKQMNRSGVDAMRYKIGMKSNVIRDLPKNAGLHSGNLIRFAVNEGGLTFVDGKLEKADLQYIGKVQRARAFADSYSQDRIPVYGSSLSSTNRTSVCINGIIK